MPLILSIALGAQPALASPPADRLTLAPGPLQLIVMGDAGTGSPTQHAVADAAATVCARRGCDGVLYLGDNFYPSGVAGLDDPLWQTHFEEPYAELDVPFFVVMGNHDYGANGAGWEWWKSDVEIAYSERSTKWTMPATHYRLDHPFATLVALDSNRVLYGLGQDQEAWVRQQAYDTPWRIAFAHHPYKSNGKHNDAGNYEGLALLGWIPGFEIAAGSEWRRFVDEHLCGQFDIVFAGHEHNRQWLEACGTHFIVSGAGGKTTSLSRSGNERYQSERAGFVWISIEAQSLTVAFYGHDGTLEYEEVLAPRP